MDEILIEEKKYVSSKQAAKITGYAKDYIGQLCREGRVPARLVGRSWYVLETAIQDHRFGAADIQPKESGQTTEETASSDQVVPSTWESPRYEAYPDNLQDSWKEWFNRVSDTKTAVPDPIPNTEPVKEEIKEDDVETSSTIEEMPEPENKREEKDEHKESGAETNVPLRVIYQEPPAELLPRNIIEKQEEQPQIEPKEDIEKDSSIKANKRVIKAIKVSSILVATLFAVLAFVNSGYLDKYLISSIQVRIISGSILYIK